MGDDEYSLSNALREIAGRKHWSDATFLARLLSALEYLDEELTTEQTNYLLDMLDEED